MFLAKLVCSSFKGLTHSRLSPLVSVAVRSSVQKSSVGYPLNYFLEYEAKGFQADDRLNRSLKLSILIKSIEKLKYNFQEQNFVMSLYRIAYYLQDDPEKQAKSYKIMNSILEHNVTKLEKFSSCFTILYKTVDRTFKFDEFIIEPLIKQALSTLKTQYTFRDYGSMLASFYSLMQKNDWKFGIDAKRAELDEYLRENLTKIGFDATLQIATTIADSGPSTSQIELFAKIVTNFEKYLLFFDFLKYFRFLRALIKVMSAENSPEKEIKQQILVVSDKLIKGFNECFREKMKKISQGMANKSKYADLTLKEYYSDVSLIMKIYVDLRTLGSWLSSLPDNKNYNPEVEFEKIFLDKN